MMTPRLRKLVLTLHIMCSVGWLGGVVGALALSVAGYASEDVQVVRAAYRGIQIVSDYVLIPMSLGSLLTGLVQTLGTTWGLFRHYWTVFKLLINVFATAVLLLETQIIAELADRAADPALNSGSLAAVQTPDLIGHTVGAFVLLLTATALGVFKPGGMTPYGRRKLQTHRVGPTRGLAGLLLDYVKPGGRVGGPGRSRRRSSPAVPDREHPA
jgi:hypothetical protein